MCADVCNYNNGDIFMYIYILDVSLGLLKGASAEGIESRGISSQRCSNATPLQQNLLRCHYAFLNLEPCSLVFLFPSPLPRLPLVRVGAGQRRGAEEVGPARRSDEEVTETKWQWRGGERSGWVRAR